MRQSYKFIFISERYQSQDIKQKPFERVNRVLDVFPLKYYGTFYRLAQLKICKHRLTVKFVFFQCNAPGPNKINLCFKMC